MTDRDLLDRAIELSGLSARQFAERVVVRDERTVRRWRAGAVPIPAVVVAKLQELTAPPAKTPRVLDARRWAKAKPRP